MGMYAGLAFTPQGEPISAEEWSAHRDQWLPTAADHAYVRSLMVPCYERGKIANWISPPKQGVDNKPFDWDYVKFHAVEAE
jgi:benzoyl-CoA 2,3-dioxygenase component B